MWFASLNGVCGVGTEGFEVDTLKKLAFPHVTLVVERGSARVSSGFLCFLECILVNVLNIFCTETVSEGKELEEVEIVQPFTRALEEDDVAVCALVLLSLSESISEVCTVESTLGDRLCGCSFSFLEMQTAATSPQVGFDVSEWGHSINVQHEK